MPVWLRHCDLFIRFAHPSTARGCGCAFEAIYGCMRVWPYACVAACELNKALYAASRRISVELLSRSGCAIWGCGTGQYVGALGQIELLEVQWVDGNPVTVLMAAKLAPRARVRRQELTSGEAVEWLTSQSFDWCRMLEVTTLTELRAVCCVWACAVCDEQVQGHVMCGMRCPAEWIGLRYLSMSLLSLRVIHWTA